MNKRLAFAYTANKNCKFSKNMLQTAYAAKRGNYE